MKFVNKTIKGGIFFIIPLVLIIILMQKAFNLLRPLANAIADKLFGDNVGYRPVYFIAVLIILILCFIGGLIASSFIGKAMVKWIEDNVLFLLPGYQLLKDTSKSIIGMEAEKSFPVVLAPIDGWMITFVIEKLDNGEIVVFVPGSPHPWSGNIMLFKETEVRPTKMTQREALKILKQTGMGISQVMTAGKIEPATN